MTPNKYDRIQIIQKVIDRTAATKYLEIGVFNGDCILGINCLQKTGVDPAPQIRFKEKLKSWLKNRRFKLCAATSDDFFAGLKPETRFDVVFVDGLHTYAQALRDVENSLRFLSDGGVILMHDCNPPSAAAAHPAGSLAEAAAMNLPGWNGEWTGDVWKAIALLRSQRPDLRAFVLDCDFGVGVVTRGKPDDRLELTSQRIAEMTYQDLARNREKILNLKPESYVEEFVAGL
jgi:SAM-dependent methyltransferase